MRGTSTWRGENGAKLYERFYPLTEIGTRDPMLYEALSKFQETRFDRSAVEAVSEDLLIHETNAKYSNPREWEVTRYDRKATLDGGVDYTGLVLGEYPVDIYAGHLAKYYSTSKFTGRPTFCYVEWTANGRPLRCFSRVAAQHPQNPDVIVCLVNSQRPGLGNLLFGKEIKRGLKQIERLAVHAGKTRIGLEFGVAAKVSICAEGEELVERAGGAVGYDG